VRTDQVELQRVELRGADALVGQLAKAGVDAIHRCVARGGALHHGGAGGHAGAAVFCEFQRDGAGVNCLDLFQAQLGWFK